MISANLNDQQYIEYYPRLKRLAVPSTSLSYAVIWPSGKSCKFVQQLLHLSTQHPFQIHAVANQVKGISFICALMSNQALAIVKIQLTVRYMYMPTVFFNSTLWCM